MVVLQEGVHDPPGGVHLAHQDVRHGGQAIDAQVARPHHGVDVILVDEVQLKGAGGVEQDDDLFEHTLILQIFQVLEQLHLLLAQPEIVAAGHVGLQRLQPAGQVGALAGGTGQGDQGGVAIVGKGGFQRVGVLLPGHLVDAVLGGVAAGQGRVFPLIAAGDIELPQIGVYTPRLEAVLQRGVQAGALAGGDKGRAGSHLHRVHRGLGEAGEPGVGGQGEGIVPVEQHRGPLRHHLAAHVPVVGHQLLLGVVTGPVEDLGVRVGDDALGLGVQRHVDHGREIVGDGDRGHADRREHGENRHGDLPKVPLFHSCPPE